VESAETALQFLHCGASLVQVCSAIQNQDLSVVQDYITGLKALLYLRSCPELKEWLGPSPPSEEVPHIPNGLRDIEDMCRKQGLPRFGPYLKRRNATRAEAIKTLDYSASPLASYPPLPVPQSVPKIRDEIGRALPSIKNWGDLPIREQVIAVVDQDKCINCGKCYLTCSDAAYQGHRIRRRNPQASHPRPLHRLRALRRRVPHPGLHHLRPSLDAVPPTARGAPHGTSRHRPQPLRRRARPSRPPLMTEGVQGSSPLTAGLSGPHRLSTSAAFSQYHHWRARLLLYFCRTIPSAVHDHFVSAFFPLFAPPRQPRHT
jgi:NAD-dependent dihydropyrimidine dehydrogenase PreA subunit